MPVKPFPTMFKTLNLHTLQKNKAAGYKEENNNILIQPHYFTFSLLFLSLLFAPQNNTLKKMLGKYKKVKKDRKTEIKENKNEQEKIKVLQLPNKNRLLKKKYTWALHSTSTLFYFSGCIPAFIYLALHFSKARKSKS